MLNVEGCCKFYIRGRPVQRTEGRSVFGVLWVLLLESIFVGVWECLLGTYKLIITCPCIS